MKRIIIMVSLTIVAIVALVFILGNAATAETGWPQNKDWNPKDGGDWQGTGSEDIPPEGKHADWYNTTKGNESWVIGSADDITRNHSAFDFKHDLIIEDGGILRLDSVRFEMNNTEANRKIWIKEGGALYISNSTISVREIYVEGELHILPVNGSSYIGIDTEAPGIVIRPGSTVEIISSMIGGSSTLVTVEDADAVIYDNTFTGTNTVGETCIYLKAAAEISFNSFYEGSSEGTYAIIAEKGVDSKIYNNTFSSFKYGGFTTYGRAIMSYGPLEIYDNFFKKMDADFDPNNPYIIVFQGVEPTDHNGKKVWEVNNFMGKTDAKNDERVNVFKQLWDVEAIVTNSYNSNLIEDAQVNVTDAEGYAFDSKFTDVDGSVMFEIPEFKVTGGDDGKNPDDDPVAKNIMDLNPYDFEAYKDGANDKVEDEHITGNTQISLQLALIQYDYGVTDLVYQGVINAGEVINLTATVFNNGYDRETTVTVEFWIDDGSRGSEKLGETDVLVDLAFVYAYLEPTIPLSYANTDVTLKAMTVFGSDSDTSNDAYETDIHVNAKPTVTVTTPTEGDTVMGIVNITGTASDDDGDVNQVRVSVTGKLDWTVVEETDPWYYNLDVSGYSNNEYEIKVRAWDNNGAGSDIVLINITVENKPTITINSPAPGSDVYGNGTENLIGATQKLDTAITQVTVSIDDGEEINATKTTGDWSQWNFPLKTITVDRLNDLSDGEHTFTAKVYDSSGLNNTVTVSYIVHSTNEATNPQIVITTDPFEITHDSVIEGTASDDFRVTAMKYRINEGDWKSITELENLGTKSVTWTVHVKPSDFEEGSNTFDVKAFDDDANTTGTLPVTKPSAVGVDLSISSVEPQNAKSGTLEKANVGDTIKVKVQIKKTGPGTLDLVTVKVTIGGIDAASHPEENVSGSFEHTFSIKLTESMKGKDTYSVVVDPANIVPETNENNNQESGDIPKIGAGDGDGDDDGGGFLPGFGFICVIAGMGTAGLLALSRKRGE